MIHWFFHAAAAASVLVLGYYVLAFRRLLAQSAAHEAELFELLAKREQDDGATSARLRLAERQRKILAKVLEQVDAQSRSESSLHPGIRAILEAVRLAESGLRAARRSSLNWCVLLSPDQELIAQPDQTTAIDRAVAWQKLGYTATVEIWPYAPGQHTEELAEHGGWPELPTLREVAHG